MQEFASSNAGIAYVCPNIIGFDSFFDVDISINGVTSVSILLGTDCNGDGLGDEYIAFARTSPPSGTGLIVELETGLLPGGSGNFSDATVSLVTAGASISIVPDVPAIRTSLAADIAVSDVLAQSLGAQIRYRGAVINGQFFGIVMSLNGIAGSNTIDGGNGEWEASPTIDVSGPGTIVVGAGSLDGSDAGLDADGDGRFSQSDPDFLQLQIGSVDPDLVSRFDFDESGDISQADVDQLSLFVGAGIGGGLFGDANNDGIPDCQDLALLRSLLPSTSLGDADYNIRLDYDLDGEIDASDETELLSIYIRLPGDTNDDLAVDFEDTNTVLTAMGSTPGSPNWNPNADLNNDNSVSFADLNIVLSNFGQDCE